MSRSDPPWLSALRDRRGVTAIEFALILPVMITLMLGTIQFAGTIQTRLSDETAAWQVADLVSRCRTVGAADLADAYTAASLIIAAAKTRPAGFAYYAASVSFNAISGAPLIDWRSDAGTPLTPDSTLLAKAAGQRSAGESVIIAGVDYSYQPTGPSGPTLVISEVAMMSPRLVPKIPFGTACDWSL
ncbi:MAG: TadE/TadG family type IV pilus assembly protein [Rhodospirillaceae bacterium]